MKHLEYMKEYGHEQLVFCNEISTGLKSLIAIHDTTLGPSCGGVRVWPYKNETEAAIQRSINTLKKGRTVIAIAHRLSTIRNAEIIYVLEDGRVVESGNHESLLDIEGVYSKLWSVQTGEKIN